MTRVLSVPWSGSYRNNCFETFMVLKNLEIIMLENWKGNNPMGLSATLSGYKNKQFFKKKSPTTLI